MRGVHQVMGECLVNAFYEGFQWREQKKKDFISKLTIPYKNNNNSTTKK